MWLTRLPATLIPVHYIFTPRTVNTCNYVILHGIWVFRAPAPLKKPRRRHLSACKTGFGRVKCLDGLERWPSGLRQRFAKPSYGVNPYPGFESRPLRSPPCTPATVIV